MLRSFLKLGANGQVYSKPQVRPALSRLCPLVAEYASGAAHLKLAHRLHLDCGEVEVVSLSWKDHVMSLHSAQLCDNIMCACP